MKKAYIYLFIGIIQLIGLFACSNDDAKSSGTATLRVGVSLDTSVKTKADASSIKLTIVKTDEDGTIIEGAPVTEYDLVEGEDREISLDAGFYLLKAVSGKDPQGKPTTEPYYVGSKLVSIVKGTTQQIAIECKLTTVVVAVDYQNLGLYENFEYETKVGTEKGDVLTYAKGDIEKKGYFIPGNLSVTFRYQNAEGGWIEKNLPKITEVKPQYQYIIKISIKEDAGDQTIPGSAGIGIEIINPTTEGDPVIVNIQIPYVSVDVEITPNRQGAKIKGIIHKYNIEGDIPTVGASFKYRKNGTGNWIATSLTNLEATLTDLSSGELYDYEFMYANKTAKGTFTTSPTITNENTWAKFSLLTEQYSNKNAVSNLIVKYRAAGEGGAWLSTPNNLDKDILRLSSLESGKKYEYRFVSLDGKIESEIMTLSQQTEEERQLPNSNFDLWAKGGKTWFAGTSEEANAKNAFWDSGNVGAATMNKNPSSPEDTDVHTAGGKACKMESQYVGIEALSLGKFAAGNIYIGRYMKTYADKKPTYGACIRFGREFASRPSQLKGWYKYSRGTTITHGDHNKEELTNSGGDKCAIYIALTDNEGLVDGDGVKTAYEIDNRMNESSSPFTTQYTLDLSENNKDVIAYGAITDEQSKGAAGWTQFTVDLKYRDLTRKPKFIIVVASASKYGDFFTGSKTSVMTIDDFELVYGDNPVSQ